MSSHERDFRKTVQILLGVIPNDQTVLREKIEYYLESINNEKPRQEMWNKAPEIVPKLLNSVYFQELGSILNEELQEIDTDWKIKLVKVFNNQ
jgi:hypothetical protein